MIKVSASFSGFDTNSLRRAVMQAAEDQIRRKVDRATRHLGGVTIRFQRKIDGSIKSIEFTGSDDAIKAAQKSLM